MKILDKKTMNIVTSDNEFSIACWQENPDRYEEIIEVTDDEQPERTGDENTGETKKSEDEKTTKDKKAAGKQL